MADREVRMPFHPERFTARERRLVDKLVEACQHLELIFWEQSDPDGLARAVMAVHPEWERIRIVVFRPDVDPHSGMVVTRTVEYPYPRP